MKNRIVGKLLVFLLILLLSASAGLEAFAESYTASTMRLLHYEGSVEIEDASGKPRFVMENVRFSSGEAMLTGENSTASVGLDDNKILTMDQDSRVEFFKQNNAIKLTLTKGAILLDVQKKLDENETLDIQTSTMSVGIRGTIVYLSEQADEKAPDNIVTTLGVLEGTAQVTYQDASNTTQSLPVPAGFEISIAKAADAGANGDANLIEPPAATRLKDDIVPEFVQKMLNADPLFQDRVAPALSESYPADGNWVWTGTISLVAQSASKLYDGLPLSRSSDVLVYGLPEFFSIRVSASGSQTNVGSSANVISGFAILNAMGEDVTSHFPSIETIPGQLVVSPAPLTVWTGSAHKVYDGEPLTNPEAKLITVSGYEEDMPAWQNASFVAPGASGGQIMYALNGSTWVHGTNPLTGETREIELRAGQKMTVRLSDDQTKSSIELLIENITEEEIPEEILRLYAENPELLSAACAETGWNRALIENRIAQLPPAEQTAAEWNGLRTERSTANGLIRNSADVRITIDTDITSYNGRVLGSQEARITEVHIDESIVVTATGQQTEVGQSPNTYTIDWGNADPGNYILSEELGTLTVYAPEAKTYSDPVTFTAASAKKVYDGTALEADGFEVTGLPEGFYAQAAVRGSQTESGSSENIIGEYAILDESGQNVTAQFTNITVKNGVLTVEPLQLGFKLTGDTVEYAGGIVFPDILLVYENGAHAGETVTGSSLMVGAAQTLSAPPLSLQRVYPLFTGDIAVLTISGAGTDAGTYTLTGSFSFPGSVASNFDLPVIKAEYTVDPVELFITTSSAAKVYDGTALTSSEVSVTGLLPGDHITVTATGSLSIIGKALNTYTIDWGETNPDNYTITETLGTLEVTSSQMAILFTAASDEKAYDGTALENAAVTVSGLPAGFTFTATASGSQTDAGSSENSVSSYAILKDGIDVTASFTDISTVSGTLTVTPAEATVTTGSAVKAYDGTELTNPEASIEGLASGETASVTATGAITEIGTAINTYSIDWGETNPDNYTITETLGTLEVTSSQTAILFTAASDEKAYDGTALENAAVTVSGLPEGFTFTATASGSQTDAGSSENSVSSYAILKDGIDVTASFTDISTVSGTLTVTPAEAIVTTGSAVKAYDGTELTNPEASIEGLASGETAFVTATGAITEIGTAINTYSIDWGETNPANYTVEEHLGTLEVTISSAEINITAASAEKVYDGTPLADDSFTVTGLPDGLTCTAVVQGSQTDAGESSNVIVSYQILNAEYADVTDSFASVALNDGLLKITPAAAVLTTASASKAYDGTPLTRNEGAVNGLVNGETVVLSFTGTITDIGSVDNTCTIDWGETNPDNYALTENLGTLEITVSTAEITFTAASAAKAYDGTDLTDSFVTASGLPDGFTFEAEVTGSQKNAGDSENVIVSYKIFNQDNEDVTGNFASIAAISGKLTVTPAAAVISTGSASKPYDGTALSSAEASITGLASGETVTLTATGTITEIGKADNTYTIDWGTVNKDNYTVTETLGTLEVTPNDGKIVITSGSSSAAYSPMGLINSDYTVEGLPDGFTAEVSVTGELNTVGSGSNTISGYTIYKDGEDKTANFTNVELKEGTLTLTKAKINVWSKSESFSYDGKSHSPSIQWQGVYGSDNPKGTDLSFSDVEWVKDAGEHKPAFTPTLTRSDLQDKYEIGDVTFGTITITPAELSITTGSASKPYDGSPLTCGDVTVNGLMGLDEITVNCNGSITEMGTAKNTYAIDWGSVNSANYTVTETLGTLEITEPLTVTLIAASAEKAYDGTALENSSVTAEGLPAGYTVEASASGSQTDAGSSANTVNDGYIIRNAANEDVTSTFTVTKVDGTLKVTPLDVTVTIGNSEFTYDIGYHFVEVSISSDAEASGEYLGDTAYGLRLPNARLELTFSNLSRRKEAGSWPLDFNAVTWNYGNESNYNVTTVPGSLTVNKRPVTVRTGSAEKVYDGTPLVNAEATVENGITGLTATATGTITDAGSVPNTYTLSLDEWYTANLEITEELGTLTVKPIEVTVTIADSVFTYDNAYHSAEVSVSSTADVSGELLGDTGYRLKLPDAMVEFTFNNPSRAKDAGSWPLDFNAVTWNYGNQSNYNITTVPGSLTVNKRPVTVRTGSAKKVYDGTPLVNAEATVENGITGLTATATGTITNAGSVQNTYTLNMDEWYTANLEITEDLGTLRVDPTPITVTARSESKVYDGSLLPENTDAPLIDGTLYEYIYAEHSEATITDAGEVTRECTIVWGEANPDNYDVTMVPGHLTITPLEVDIDLGGYNYDSSDGSWSYDGNFHGPNVSVSCADEGFTFSPISDTDWEIIWSSRGDVIQVHAAGGGAEEGVTYNFTYEVSGPSGKEGNYHINVTGDTLKISERRIYITVPDDPPVIYVPVHDDTPEIIVDAP